MKLSSMCASWSHMEKSMLKRFLIWLQVNGPVAYWHNHDVIPQRPDMETQKEAPKHNCDLWDYPFGDPRCEACQQERTNV